MTEISLIVTLNNQFNSTQLELDSGQIFRLSLTNTFHCSVRTIGHRQFRIFSRSGSVFEILSFSDKFIAIGVNSSATNLTYSLVAIRLSPSPSFHYYMESLRLRIHWRKLRINIVNSSGEIKV